MKQLFAFFSSFLVLTAFAPVMAYADSQCIPLYGGGQICPQVDNLLIDKKVQNPSTQEFVDNLGPTDPAYQANQPIFFRITISNKGNSAISNISVKDILPQYIEYVSVTGGNGQYDKAKKTLTVTIDKLNGNDTKTLSLTGVTDSASQLPQDQPGMCMGNQKKYNFQALVILF